jgi:hypothetical protein
MPEAEPVQAASPRARSTSGCTHTAEVATTVPAFKINAQGWVTSVGSFGDVFVELFGGASDGIEYWLSISDAE